jgi:hypothetical protein
MVNISHQKNLLRRKMPPRHAGKSDPAEKQKSVRR